MHAGDVDLGRQIDIPALNTLTPIGLQWSSFAQAASKFIRCCKVLLSSADVHDRRHRVASFRFS